jgi:FtsZ-binding cell division protein ZapB
MTEVGDDTKYAVCYPSESQYKQWERRADEMGYNSVSRFIVEMVEAGYSQISSTITYDEETSELREQRNELKRELDDSRERIDRLEEQLYRGERRTIIQFLDQQEAGASFADIVQHLIDDAPVRVAETLEQMEADQITSEDGTYRLIEDETNGVR